MSLEEIREHNKTKVIETALECFVCNGIENTKISDIANKAGLTHRSVYRYFETKSDLVLASALLFWEKIVETSQKAYAQSQIDKLSGAKQIEQILLAYAEQYFTGKDSLVFILEAEIFISRNGMLKHIENMPPRKFESKTAPLSKAIMTGIEDGSIKNKERAILNYYNAYDSLLGLMQKLAIRNNPDKEYDKKRLHEFCSILTKSICE